MPFNFMTGIHPQTKQPMALIGAEPELLQPATVLQILRLIKQSFPDLFTQVQLEILKPINGNRGLELPDDFSKEKGGA